MPAKVRDYYDWLAAQYDQATAAWGWAAPEHVWAAAADAVHRGAGLVDLGVGTGQTSIPFLRAGCRCLGLDFSPHMLAEARSKHLRLGLVQADLDARYWPLSDGSFDIAISAGVYECLTQPRHFLSECHRCLRPDGRLVFTFDEFIPGHPAQGVRIGRADSGIPNPIEDLAGWLLRRYTIDDVSAWVDEAGFELLHERRIEADVHFHFEVPVYYRLVIARRR